MDLRRLTTFQAVIEAGNFARAAQRLRIGASTVTLHIQQLESDLGGPVFVRHGRRLRLTELGTSLAGHAEAISRHLTAVAQEAAELGSAGRGTVRVGGIEPLAHLDLVPLLARLGRDRPNMTLLLEVGGTALVSAGVAEGRLAFAVCSAPPAELGLRFEPLFREPIGLLLPAGHDLVHTAEAGSEAKRCKAGHDLAHTAEAGSEAKRRKAGHDLAHPGEAGSEPKRRKAGHDVVHPGEREGDEAGGGSDGAVAAEQLAAQPVVLSEPGCAYRAHVLDAFRDRGVALDVRAEIGSTAAAVEAVRAGLGIALLPTAGLRPPPAGLVVRRVAGMDLGLGVGIVLPRAGEPYSALTSQVLAAIRKAAPRWRP